MIPFGSYNMMFVFARERGVYAMLGVNVWLHNIPYENCKDFALRCFYKSKAGLFKGAVSVLRGGINDDIAPIFANFWLFLSPATSFFLCSFFTFFIPGVIMGTSRVYCMLPRL